MLDVLETFVPQCTYVHHYHLRSRPAALQANEVCHHSFTYVRMDSSVKAGQQERFTKQLLCDVQVERRQELVDRFNDDEPWKGRLRHGEHVEF